MDIGKPRPGVEEWSNPLNGFHVLRLHYVADPAKRDPAWKANASRSMHPRAWRREYEIDWASPEGEPVIPEFDEAIHVKEVTIDPTLRLLRFWDFGFDSPVVLFAQLTLWDQLRVVRELCPFNTTLRQLIPSAEAVARELLGPDKYLGGERASDYGGRETDDDLDPSPFRFDTIPVTQQVDKWGRQTVPERRTFDAGDPEGYSRKSLGVEAAVMAQHGLRLHTIRPGTTVSYDQLRQRLLRTVMVPGQGRVPAFVVAPQCRLLRQALGGAFCRSLLPPYKPKKTHPFGDLVDAVRYGNDNLTTLRQGGDRVLRATATRDIIETRA
jgi:hypothetical protein